MAPTSDKKFSKKNKSVKLYKKKSSKRNIFVQELEELKKGYEQLDTTSFETFEQLPLTSYTLQGLKQNKYVKLTDIQRESIGLALKGHDILGAAKTGSGKTLAFVVPVLECLFREGWSRPAGLGALVITPTRELAFQIFKVFNNVGKFHDFTVALVIGGKDLEIERKVLNQYNIVICTPGRLLQHMDENPLFDAVTLQILVLDEADRILDLGFAKTMNAIIENLPQERQTLLFSATQTKSVKDLARLSLKDPKYVSVHENAKYSTPESLVQSYLVCEAHDKMNFLWSFLKRHKKQKILVFMSTCKQVKYTFESFCRLRPGVCVTALYGGLHQLRRMERYKDFCNKQNVVMFATDIAARGLDFPNVKWVVQLDCPEDVNTYIHRAGRTARYQGGGESVLVLLPSEKDSMVEQLETRRIPITEIKVNPRELTSITKKLQNICSKSLELSQSSQRAFNAYLKNVFLMKDKTVFDVQKIDMESYARSLGLLTTPRTRFINKHLKNQQKSERPLDTSAEDSEMAKFEIKSECPSYISKENSETVDSTNENVDTLKMEDSETADFTSRDLDTSGEGSEAADSSSKNVGTSVADFKNADFKTSYRSLNAGEKFYDFGGSDDDDSDTFNHCDVRECNEEPIVMEVAPKKVITKAAAVKKILKKNIKPNTKIVFDDEGEVVGGFKKLVTPMSDDDDEAIVQFHGASFPFRPEYGVKKMMHMLPEIDKTDKDANKQKVRIEHQEKKKQLKKLRQKRDLREVEDPSEDASKYEEEDEDASSRKENLRHYIKELPDPEKYFGRDSENSDYDDDMEGPVPETFSGSMESMSETEEEPKQKQKRKKKQMQSSCKRSKLSKELPSTVGAALALGGDEELALTLLQGT